MKVVELIDKLSLLPDDAEVLICPADFVPTEIEEVSLITVSEEDILNRTCKIGEQVVTLSDF